METPNNQAPSPSSPPSIAEALRDLLAGIQEWFSQRRAISRDSKLKEDLFDHRKVRNLRGIIIIHLFKKIF